LEQPIRQDQQRESGNISGARFAALGFELAGIVVAGLISGYYLDEHLHTAPLFVLLLTLGGMGGALYRLLWTLKRFSSHSDDGD
jgi:F0F1-type ATP synthase assembly protein I